MSRVEIVYGRSADVAAFVASIPPFVPTRGFGEFQAIGFAIDAKFVAGVIYQNWSPEAGVIEMSAAATDPRWVTRKSLLAVFALPFDDLGCQMVVFRIGEKNDRMRSIARRLGFSEVTIPRMLGRNEGQCIATLTVENWRLRLGRIVQAG